MFSVDTNVARGLQQIYEGTLFLILRVAAVTFLLPIFVVPTLATFALGGWLSSLYMRTQLSVKREMGRTQAPVLGHFVGAVAGLVSIRAYGAQEAFVQESYRRIDAYSRTALIHNALIR